MDAQATAFARAFVRATGGPAPGDAFAFGDSPEMAEELLALVRSGRKQATAGLLADHEREREPVPQAGGTSIVLDGAGAPACVIRTTQVDVGPLRTADDAFAWDEGEGDRSLAYWMDVHERFFRRRCAALGIPFSHDLDVVFERFELAWDPAAG